MATEYTHSMPTPPFSPQNQRMPDETTEDPLKSTVNLLDSLVAFYQHERMWVYRTRATLEDAFNSPPIPNDPSSSYSQSSSSSYQDPSRGLPMIPRHENFHAPRTAQEQQEQQTRWVRRKKGFKLRLDGIRAKRVISTQPVGQSPEPEQLQPREQILEMFEKMMEARMESCQRVNKLVRDANRANLHYR